MIGDPALDDGSEVQLEWALDATSPSGLWRGFRCRASTDFATPTHECETDVGGRIRTSTIQWSSLTTKTRLSLAPWKILS